MGTVMRNAMMIAGAAYGCIFGPLGGPLLIIYMLIIRAIASNTFPKLTVANGKLCIVYPETNIVTKCAISQEN